MAKNIQSNHEEKSPGVTPNQAGLYQKIASKSDRVIKKLFEQEVPEIASGTVFRIGSERPISPKNLKLNKCCSSGRLLLSKSAFATPRTRRPFSAIAFIFLVNFSRLLRK